MKQTLQECWFHGPHQNWDFGADLNAQASNAIWLHETQNSIVETFRSDLKYNIVWIILEWFFTMHVIFVSITNPRWLPSQDMYSLTLNTLGKWIKKTTLYSLKENTFKIYFSKQLIQLLAVPQLECYTFKKTYCPTNLPDNICIALFAHSSFKYFIHVPIENYMKLLPLNYQVSRYKKKPI